MLFGAGSPHCSWVPPSYGWKDIRVSRVEPGPEISAGQTGSRFLVFFVSILYLPFSCSVFGGTEANRLLKERERLDF